jgi:hypothetical protein
MAAPQMTQTAAVALLREVSGVLGREGRHHAGANVRSAQLAEMRSIIQHAAGASERSADSSSAVWRLSIATQRTSTGPSCPCPRVAVTGQPPARGDPLPPRPHHIVDRERTRSALTPREEP